MTRTRIHCTRLSLHSASITAMDGLGAGTKLTCSTGYIFVPSTFDYKSRLLLQELFLFTMKLKLSHTQLTLRVKLATITSPLGVMIGRSSMSMVESVSTTTPVTRLESVINSNSFKYTAKDFCFGFHTLKKAWFQIVHWRFSHVCDTSKTCIIVQALDKGVTRGIFAYVDVWSLPLHL